MNTASSLDGCSSVWWSQTLHVYWPWSWCGFQTDLTAACWRCRKTSVQKQNRTQQTESNAEELCRCMWRLLCNFSTEEFRAPHQRKGCFPSWSWSCGSVHTHGPSLRVWRCFQTADGPRWSEHESEKKTKQNRSAVAEPARGQIHTDRLEPAEELQT